MELSRICVAIQAKEKPATNGGFIGQNVACLSLIERTKPAAELSPPTFGTTGLITDIDILHCGELRGQGIHGHGSAQVRLREAADKV